MGRVVGSVFPTVHLNIKNLTTIVLQHSGDCTAVTLDMHDPLRGQIKGKHTPNSVHKGSFMVSRHVGISVKFCPFFVSDVMIESTELHILYKSPLTIAVNSLTL